MDLDMVYVHVGTGRTVSTYYCSRCDGYYGVSHESPVGEFSCHTLGQTVQASCACRSCQVSILAYPNGGVFVPWFIMETLEARTWELSQQDPDSTALARRGSRPLA